jgi:small subunit ribosomal protein S16
MGSATGSPPGVPAARQRNFWEKTAPVAVKIKLKRLGKIRAPYYRIIVADARTKRDGRAIEEIGKYHPKAEPSFIEVNSERAQHWLSVGAQPTDPVRKIFEITGDWQKFKGLPGTEGTLKTAAPKEDRKEVFAAAVKENMGDSAPAPKGRGRSAAAAKDSEAATEKSGKTAAKDTAAKDTGSAKAERPAKAKADEQPAKAKADEQPAKAKADEQPAKSGVATEDAKDTPADAKAKDGPAKASGAAKDSTAKDSTAKDSTAKDSAAKSSTAKASTAKGAKDDAADASAADTAQASADTADEPADGSAAQPAAVAADAEPASGD